MYAALFEMDSMFGRHQYIFEGNSPVSVMVEFENEQSLECLIRHGRYEESAKGQLALDKLEDVYNKYVAGTITMDDIASIDIKISIGAIRCCLVAEGEDAIAAIKAQYPKARSR